MAWTRIAGTAELPPGALIEVVKGNELYAICNTGGEIRALSGRCPHQGGPLGQGMLEDGLITCPWHAWQFDPTTGACDFEAGGSIPTYPVRVEGDEVLIDA